jgi:hypothetical protein
MSMTERKLINIIQERNAHAKVVLHYKEDSGRNDPCLL